MLMANDDAFLQCDDVCCCCCRMNVILHTAAAASPPLSLSSFLTASLCQVLLAFFVVETKNYEIIMITILDTS